ncbi:ribonuclease H-like domain-containing protein [Patescibacteria group bacterium]|nr:ribonuclease H-like domain-containing protein [Patescibacteria group bacterium]MBU1200020.1 ribonuclease H-like domain-containing protein [Patescibacteria group bacterium]MBU1256710.1 ribonuclease H-like domain-containing protein [Patescibacteria group bacterium]MBU1457433.1 ribonuclease H-like domain-containing protein [Patescibacteria group bacterium]
MIEVIFDVETQKLFEEIEDHDPGKLLVSIVSLYRRELDENFREIAGTMKSFWIDEAGREPRIGGMWPWFEEADRIVGFNSLGFDVPALEPLYKNDFNKLNHFDLMDVIKNVLGHRLSLDAIARETLGKVKSGVGTQAVEWWKIKDKKSLDLLQKYCEMDVLITKDVYDFGLENKRLKYIDKWNELREVEVDFSYPNKEPETETQMGLF